MAGMIPGSGPGTAMTENDVKSSHLGGYAGAKYLFKKACRLGYAELSKLHWGLSRRPAAPSPRVYSATVSFNNARAGRG